ncbi:MAG: CHAT domain-containing protein [Chitinivibrionia bacterium]|nr:CHAT domain-containing protein [Chitinivibrionia bacterium]
MLGIPVEALVDQDGMYIGDRFVVSYIPSATIYTWLKERSRERKRTAANQSLLVGDPPFTETQLAAMENTDDLAAECARPSERNVDVVKLRYVLARNEEALSSLDRLPCTRLEVQGIAPMLPEPTLLVGPDASEQQMVQLAEAGRLKDFKTIHLATHAFVDDEQPERSALILSRANLPDPLEAAMVGTRIYDGLVTAKEILREWKLDADLVTLSACETGLGKVVGGEGYVGFAHAFLQAGARTLLVSLWKVEDRATSLLMQRFYENWTGRYNDARHGQREQPMSKAEALKEAKHYLRTYTEDDGKKPFEHPYFWSAFILIGDRE